MKVLKNIDVLKKAINNISNLGFVPTMGGLHKGHLSLIKESLKKCKITIISIYVNPKQFNKKSDFLNYPRNIKKDLDSLKKIKVDYVFIPNKEEMNKIKINKKIILPKSQKILCAKFRKGHFEGVLDVMGKFTKLIKPKYIFMGEKDFQQFFLVRNFIRNNYKSRIYFCRTIRDINKVALSSRNHLLSKKQLYKAGLIAKTLIKLKSEISKKKFINNNLKITKKKLIKKFKIKIDYLEIRNEKDLKLSDTKNKFKLFIAYYIKKIRLIDNF